MSREDRKEGVCLCVCVEKRGGRRERHVCGGEARMINFFNSITTTIIKIFFSFKNLPHFPFHALCFHQLNSDAVVENIKDHMIIQKCKKQQEICMLHCLS